MSLSVCKMDRSNHNKYKELYENITKPEDAVLLAQLAMCDKQDHELIFIFPGYNKSINKYHRDEYTRALMLAEIYKVD